MYIHIIYISRSVAIKSHELSHLISSEYHELNRLNITNWTGLRLDSSVLSLNIMCIYVSSTYHNAEQKTWVDSCASSLHIMYIRIICISRSVATNLHEPNHLISSKYHELSRQNITNWTGNAVRLICAIFHYVYMYHSNITNWVTWVSRTEPPLIVQISRIASSNYHELIRKYR